MTEFKIFQQSFSVFDTKQCCTGNPAVFLPMTLPPLGKNSLIFIPVML